jgi:GntR family transcriptional regulator / MocR family aminotransferase
VRAGLKLVPVPVDADVIDAQAVARRTVVAKTAHVGRMSPGRTVSDWRLHEMARRTALVDWARSWKAWLLQDGYGGEFRDRGPPLTALAAIDGGDRVIYLGTLKPLGTGLCGGATQAPSLKSPAKRMASLIDQKIAGFRVGLSAESQMSKNG